MTKVKNMDKVQLLAEKTWQHMHSETFWVGHETSLHAICKQVARKENIDANPAQLRLAAKQIERRLV